MEPQDSSSRFKNSDLSEENLADNQRPVAKTSALRVIPRASFLWRLFYWPFYLFCRVWIRVRIQGLEHIDNSCGGLLLINHQSFLDPLLAAVMLRRPVCYLARDNLFRVPVIGSILRKTHVIAISREAARGSSIRVAIEQLEAGFLVGIFPEGTRSTTDEVGRFRPGFVAIARRTTQPIYPVGLAGCYRILPKGAWFLRPGRVQIVYGAPLTEDEVSRFRSGTDDAALCELARARVAECAKLAAELLRDPVPLAGR
jgi:1-acyl-sn-glycerol-3-phosphate acyltransferase